MFADPYEIESPLARRFSQVFLVALASLITSGTGLLSFVNQAESPEWLKNMVLASAVMVGTSFAGWAICSLGVYLRGQTRFDRAR